MTSSSWWARHRTPLVIVAVAVVVLAAAVVVFVRRSGDGGTPRPSASGAVTIPVGSGVTLDALVYEPAGSGRHPLVVMPTSWSSPVTEYAFIAARFVRAGFIVLAYVQRGFQTSGGEVDFAGPATQHDARTVLTWALAHTRADPRRVGMLGVSYGAGMSLLTAAHDRRVRAVVALSTWTDLAAALHPHGTTSTATFTGLVQSAKASGHLDRQFTDAGAQVSSDPVAGGARLASLAVARSPLTYVDGLNRNKPAIMIANGWEDSDFPAGEVVPFFERLTTAKRLELAPGDHGGPELTGLYTAGANVPVDDAVAWMRHHLQGARTALDAQQPVQLTDPTSGIRRGYPSWPGTRNQATVSLGAPGATTTSITTVASTWTAQLVSGVDTPATSGPQVAVAGPSYRAPVAAVATVSPGNGLVWNGPTLTSPVLVSGSPSVSFGLASTSADATVIAYLYDATVPGSGTLMSVTPFTATGLTTRARPVTIPLEPVSWTLAAGHHLALVLDTVDPRWHSVQRAGTPLTVSSTGTVPATLRLPLAG